MFTPPSMLAAPANGVCLRKISEYFCVYGFIGIGSSPPTSDRELAALDIG